MINKIKSGFMKLVNKARENQFAAFIVLAIVVAGILMGVSLWLYNESGAAQLDLSRPSYQAAREESARKEKAEKEKAEKEKRTKEDFSADGNVDEKALEEFRGIYKARLNKIKANAFRPDPLSDDSLHILDDAQ